MPIDPRQAEWTPVTEAVHAVAHCLRPGSTAGDFVADLMAQAVWVRDWWADRNTKAPGARHLASLNRLPNILNCEIRPCQLYTVFAAR